MMFAGVCIRRRIGMQRIAVTVVIMTASAALRMME